jgi:hypothetical protein
MAETPWACGSTCSHRKPVREPLLYIAMPFRAGRYSQRENVARANAVGRHFASLGLAVVVPHNLSMEMDPFNRLGDDYWLRTTANVLIGCTHIVCGPEWETSAGAVDERALADAHDLTPIVMERMPDAP